MSSYFVNSLSTCYGQTAGLDSCVDVNYHRNVNYPSAGSVYPSFGARYPYISKQERLEDQNGDFYGTNRLSHLPPNSPCSSPPNMHGGSSHQQQHNLHPIQSSNERSSCSVRTNSNSGNSYFPNGQIRNNVEESRTPPTQHTPPTPTHTQPQQQNQQQNSTHGENQFNGSHHIYPWMRRMQYSQGKEGIVCISNCFSTHTILFKIIPILINVKTNCKRLILVLWVTCQIKINYIGINMTIFIPFDLD
ncbi:hypothetical protein ACJMK2_021505 [Sinanodonta woodiana]|uniref:Uncharacterized protein n=1 Tax=Sinanodonta woodiana TaxID=1069815 RepID=A0ABD3TGZ1_SINWO